MTSRRHPARAEPGSARDQTRRSRKTSMSRPAPPPVPPPNVREMLGRHEFLAGIEPAHLDLLATVGDLVEWQAGDLIFKVGDPADHCYLLTSGHVAITVHSPGGADIVVASLGAGSWLGWSWLYPPFSWHFDAHAIEHSTAIALRGPELRQLFSDHPDIGLEFMRRFAHTAVQRLAAARMQLLDLYSTRTASVDTEDSESSDDHQA